MSDVKRKELLAFPERKWDADSEYDSVYIVPSGKKHDSGYMLMAIVGVRDRSPVEIAAYCDDINWQIEPTNYCNLRTDCEYPSGIIHAWQRGARFIVGCSLSSTEITVKQNCPKN